MRWIAAALVLAAPMGSGALVLSTPEQVQEASVAAGFCYGQDYALQYIEKKYPELKAQVMRVRAKFMRTFPGACEYLDSALSKINAKAWGDAKKRSIEAIAGLQPGSLAEASEILVEFYERMDISRMNDGIMPVALELLIAASRPNRLDPTWEMRQGWRRKFSTQGHPKASGLSLLVEAPRSWKQEEGKRPRIVQKWTSQNGNGLDGLTLSVASSSSSGSGMRVEDEFVTQLKGLGPREVCRAETASMSSEALRLRARQVTLEGKLGVVCSFVQTISRMDLSVSMSWGMLFLPFGDKIIVIGSYSAHRDGESGEKSDARAGAMLNAFANTLVIMDKYIKVK